MFERMEAKALKIILFSKIFYPSNRIGAVRPSNFAKYLTEFGNDVTVVTQFNVDSSNVEMEGVKIIRISNSTLISKLIAKNDARVKRKLVELTPSLSNSEELLTTATALQRIKKTIGKIIREAFEFIIEYDWYRMALRRMKSELGESHYDVAISSYGPLASFLMGRAAKKNHLATSWICDYRDNMTSAVYSGLLNKLYKAFENAAVRHSEAIIFVSKGQREMFLKKHTQRSTGLKCHVVYNGYEDLAGSAEIEDINDRVLKIAYTGQLYAGKSNFRLLFDVIDELVRESAIDARNVLFSYAGQNSSEFEKQLAQYSSLHGICQNFGYVSKSEAEALQEQSDILIALVWNSTEEQGILSGKFLEYLQRHKPIIALTSGNLAKGELSSMVNEMRLGIACEYCNYATDKLKLKQYVHMQYKLKMGGNNLVYSPDDLKIKRFTYENVSKELLKIICSL